MQFASLLLDSIDFVIPAKDQQQASSSEQHPSQEVNEKTLNFAKFSLISSKFASCSLQPSFLLVARNYSNTFGNMSKLLPLLSSGAMRSSVAFSPSLRFINQKNPHQVQAMEKFFDELYHHQQDDSSGEDKETATTAQMSECFFYLTRSLQNLVCSSIAFDSSSRLLNQYLPRFQMLRVLDLSYCKEAVTDDLLGSLFNPDHNNNNNANRNVVVVDEDASPSSSSSSSSSSKISSLKLLCLCGNFRITASGFAKHLGAALGLHRSLEELHLDSCDGLISDKDEEDTFGLFSTIGKFRNLQCFSMASLHVQSPRFWHTGLQAFVNEESKQRHLLLDDTDTKSSALLFAPLTSLDFSENNAFDDKCLEILFGEDTINSGVHRTTFGLKRLNLFCCSELTSQGVSKFLFETPVMSTLEFLDMSYCDLLEGDLWLPQQQQQSASSPVLKELILEGVHGIDDTSIRKIGEVFGETLKVLDVSCCPRITDEAFIPKFIYNPDNNHDVHQSAPTTSFQLLFPALHRLSLCCCQSISGDKFFASLLTNNTPNGNNGMTSGDDNNMMMNQANHTHQNHNHTCQHSHHQHQHGHNHNNHSHHHHHDHATATNNDDDNDDNGTNTSTKHQHRLPEHTSQKNQHHEVFLFPQLQCLHCNCTQMSDEAIQRMNTSVPQLKVIREI